MASLSAPSLCFVRSSSLNSIRQAPVGVKAAGLTGGIRQFRLRTSRLSRRITCAAKPETVTKVSEIVRKQLALGPEKEVSGESKFTDLGADSLDTVEIVMGLEEEFDISVEEESSQNITTVQDAAELIDKLLEKKATPA